MRRIATVTVSGLLCALVGGTAVAERAPKLNRSSQVAALAKTFYSSLEVIHATHSNPNRQGTPLLSNLAACQFTAQRRLSHPGLKAFFPSKEFFASTCADGRYAVISVDRVQQVRLISLSPELRLPASAWDEALAGPVRIHSRADVRRYVAAYLHLVHQVPVAESDVRVTRTAASAAAKGSRDYVATTRVLRVQSRRLVYTVRLGSADGKSWAVASTGIDYRD